MCIHPFIIWEGISCFFFFYGLLCFFLPYSESSYKQKKNRRHISFSLDCCYVRWNNTSIVAVDSCNFCILLKKDENQKITVSAHLQHNHLFVGNKKIVVCDLWYCYSSAKGLQCHMQSMKQSFPIHISYNHRQRKGTLEYFQQDIVKALSCIQLLGTLFFSNKKRTLYKS